ncbi:carbohydrate deacetylase [Candidatus Nitrospira bockiana]
MRVLIINADGYGFTPGITRAIEECIAFGTVRSLSANVNFPHADGLARLVLAHPELSVGCHVNPIVGAPVLPAGRVPSLVDETGHFHYRTFTRRFLAGRISAKELRAEMTAQVQKTRDLAGRAFSHIDFHMGLHRLPRLYDLFLDVAKESGVGRIRTHRYLVGLESRCRTLRHAAHLLVNPLRALKWFWNLRLRRKALRRGLAMPDRRVEITHAGLYADRISVRAHLRLLESLPPGVSELVVHPGYVEPELRRWSTYLHQRERERAVLLDAEFRRALQRSDIRLAGYREIPLLA